jgi:hypothetical protein
VPSKADILNKYAKKHKVRPSLLSKVFQIERARLRSGESEKQYRQEEILKILEEEAERPDQK